MNIFLVKSSQTSQYLFTFIFILSLQEWHRLTVPLENTSCPLCNNSVPLLELVPHLTVVHAVTPPSTGHALLLWILTSTQARRNNNTMLNNHHLSAMLLQNMLPAVLKNPPPAGIAAAHSQQVATPTSNILTATPPRINHPTVSFKKRVCQNLVPHTSSITALARERELVSQSQLFFPSCLSRPISHWLVKTARKEKLGLRYMLSFSDQCRVLANNLVK